MFQPLPCTLYSLGRYPSKDDSILCARPGSLAEVDPPLMQRITLSSCDLQRLDANMIACFQLLASANSGGHSARLDGVQLVVTGAQAASFNVAFVTKPLADPHRSLERVRRWFREQRLPFCVRIRSGLDPETGRACRALGLTDIDSMPGMWLPDTNLAPDRCGDLDILHVDEPGAASDQASVLEHGFPMPAEFAAMLVAEPLLHLAETELYVGYHAGEAVAASSLVVSNGVAGVYNVATLPRFRHRGFGEAMTRHAVLRGHELGCDVAILQATPPGRPIYERIGFHTVAHYLTYEQP